jgi:hypothetical protein
MRAIAKRLALRAPARTPEIGFARFHVCAYRLRICNFGFCHFFLLLCLFLIDEEEKKVKGKVKKIILKGKSTDCFTFTLQFIKIYPRLLPGNGD